MKYTLTDNAKELALIAARNLVASPYIYLPDSLRDNPEDLADILIEFVELNDMTEYQEDIQDAIETAYRDGYDKGYTVGFDDGVEIE